MTQPQLYYSVLTAVGEARLANAAALDSPLQISHMAVGDGAGGLPQPSREQKALLGERYRAQLNSLQPDPLNPSQIIAELVIPETVGGWWIREMGLYDRSGNLVAASNCPPSYKPKMAEGSKRTQVLRMVLIVSSTASVELKIDPSVVLATREYVDRAKGNMARFHSYNTTATLTEKDFGCICSFANAGYTVTLPQASSGPSAATLRLVNVGAGDITFVCRQGDAFNMLKPKAESFVLSALDSITISTNGKDRWWAIGGSVQLVESPALRRFLGEQVGTTAAPRDNSTRLATTEFVSHALGNTAGVIRFDKNTALSLAHAGKLVSLGGSGELTLTLPPAKQAQSLAYHLAPSSMSAHWTISAPDSCLIGAGIPSNTQTTFSLGTREMATVISDGSGWMVFTGKRMQQTPPLFDASQQLATTEFVQRAAGNMARFQSYNAATAMTEKDFGCICSFANGNYTVTLPAASSGPSAATLRLVNIGFGNIHFICRPGDGFNTLSPGATEFVLGPRDSVTLSTNGFTRWWTLGSGALLQFSPQFAAALGVTGWKREPSGLIEQWGVISLNDNHSVAVTLPIAFSSEIFGVIASVQAATLAGPGEFTTAGAHRNGASLTSIVIDANSGPTVGVSQLIHWRAYGR